MGLFSVVLCHCTCTVLFSGAPMLPCDFQEGFCQWFQLIDDEFHWTRNKGKTNSTNTGPNVDHTTGTGD